MEKFPDFHDVLVCDYFRVFLEKRKIWQGFRYERPKDVSGLDISL